MWSRLRSLVAQVRSDRWRHLRWLALGVVVGVLIVLVAPSLTADPKRLEPGELVLLSGRDDSLGDQRQALINEWNALHPANQARIVELSGQADAQHSEMVAHAQSGRDDADVYNLDITWTAEFADHGYLRRLDESRLDTTGFLTKPLLTCRYADALWALPFNTDAGLLYYRSDLVPAPPNSWAQLKREVERVFAERPDRGPVLQAGYTGQLANYEGLTVNALEAIWAAGGEVVDPAGNVVLDETLSDSQAGVDRLRPTSVNPQFVLPEAFSADEARSAQEFRDGKVLFMRNWPVAYRSLEATAKENAPAPSLPFGVARLPGPSALGGQNLAIAAHSGKPKAAQALIEFLTDTRSQQILFERGGLPATREIVYRDAAVTSRYRYAPVLLEAIQQAQLRPMSPHYPRFSEVFRAGIDHALKSGRPLPEDFSDRLREALKGR